MSMTKIPRWRVTLVKEGDPVYGAPVFNRSDIVYSMFSFLKKLAEEEVWAVYLSSKLNPIGTQMISRGSLNSSVIHPREVFKAAIISTAHSVILVHNHPSGFCSPSNDDVLLTERLSEAGKLLGIHLLDHIIIGEEEYFSFRDNGRLSEIK